MARGKRSADCARKQTPRREISPRGFSTLYRAVPAPPCCRTYSPLFIRAEAMASGTAFYAASYAVLSGRPSAIFGNATPFFTAYAHSAVRVASFCSFQKFPAFYALADFAPLKRHLGALYALPALRCPFAPHRAEGRSAPSRGSTPKFCLNR